MKICKTFTLFLVLAGMVHADEFYRQSIRLPIGASPELEATANDVAQSLAAATGRAFTVSPEPGEGDIELRAAGADDPALKDRGAEAFRLQSGAKQAGLTISGNSELALRHGLYRYLEELGFRWLLPNENWTIVPELKSIRLEIDRVEEPAFRLRNFFGTGGFGGKLPVDPDLELQARWELWKRRNLMGGDIQPAGHSGEAFNAAHKAELEARPEFLAEIGGQRQPWDVTTKLCVSNPELRQLYIEDRLAKMRQQVKLSPHAAASTCVSVEPADGGGHCECAECRKLGSVSDRVFYMANEAAKALAAEFPDKLANLYAYNEHAAPPDFSVEPNVLVLIAPYAFQRTGLPGDELVKAWGTRAENLGIYDYWAIPDWANCQPVFSAVQTGPRKIRFWHDQGANAFLGESSFSAGNVGLTWYVASRLLWNPEADERAIADEFFRLAFGPAVAPMRRMIERWDEGFLLSGHELALSFRDLAGARALAADNTAVRARIVDFGLYVQYLRLWCAYDEAKPGSSERAEHAAALVDYLWRIYPTAMVHSFRMFQLVALRYEKKDARLLDTWPLKDAAAPAWQSLKVPDSTLIGEFIADGVRDFTPLDFEPRQFSETLVPLHRPDSLSAETVPSPQFTGTHDFECWLPESVKSLPLSIRCGKRDDYPGNLIIVVGSDGKEVFRHLAPSDGEWHDLQIPATAPATGAGNYRMTISDQKIFFSLKVPRNLPFVVKGWKGCPALPSKVWFQVPPGAKRLAVASESVVPLKLTTSTGELLPQVKDKLFVVDVPAGQDGQIWTLSDFKSYQPLRLLNSPNVFAFSPEGVMVPGD